MHETHETAETQVFDLVRQFRWMCSKLLASYTELQNRKTGGIICYILLFLITIVRNIQRSIELRDFLLILYREFVTIHSRFEQVWRQRNHELEFQILM